MNANELADELMKFYNLKENTAPIQIYDLAATMLRQQQEQIEELEKENTDLRYLIATKLEQQDGISLNSMAHPITNTPEPSYEIDPNKLETIEIDLPSSEPVAWIDPRELDMVVSTSVTKHKQFDTDIPLYTHPANLTDEEIEQIGKEYGIKSVYQFAYYEFAKAILRKAQEK